MSSPTQPSAATISSSTGPPSLFEMGLQGEPQKEPQQERQKELREIKGNENHEDVIKKELETERAVLLDCYADWCPPCHTMRPVLQRFLNMAEFERIGFLRLNVDDREGDDPGPDIRGVPTFQIYELEGEELKVTDEFVGAGPRAVEQMLVKVARKIADRKKKDRAAGGNAGPTPSNPERENAAPGVGSAAAQGQDAISASNR